MFCKNRSTDDAIFVVKNVREKYGERLITVCIDRIAAYDHVRRDFLFIVLKMITGAKRLIGTTSPLARIKGKIDVLVGCRQGAKISLHLQLLLRLPSC